MQAASLAALTRLRDARDTRIAASEAAIPGIVWFVVIAGGAITLAFATLLGAGHLRLHLTLLSLLSLSGMLILLMIVALSHPFRGDFRIRSDPFVKASTQMHKR